MSWFTPDQPERLAKKKEFVDNPNLKERARMKDRIAAGAGREYQRESVPDVQGKVVKGIVIEKPAPKKTKV